MASLSILYEFVIVRVVSGGYKVVPGGVWVLFGMFGGVHDKIISSQLAS